MMIKGGLSPPVSARLCLNMFSVGRQKLRKPRWLLCGCLFKAKQQQQCINTNTSMKRVYRSIAAIASLAAIGVGPQCVVGESSSSKISSRFSASLERADEKMSNNNNVDSSTPAFLSEENNDIDAETVVDPSHQRRELAWWNVVLQVGMFIIVII